jgi:hypothetical protein
VENQVKGAWVIGFEFLLAISLMLSKKFGLQRDVSRFVYTMDVTLHVPRYMERSKTKFYLFLGIKSVLTLWSLQRQPQSRTSD